MIDKDKSETSYSGNPLPGSVAVPCKTPNCNAAIESGFVFNMEENGLRDSFVKSARIPVGRVSLWVQCTQIPRQDSLQLWL